MKEYFSYALAQNTKNEFELTLQCFLKDIADLHLREEYCLITDRLTVLKQLSEEIEFSCVKKCYVDAINSVINIDIIT